MAFTSDRHTWDEDIKAFDIRFYTATFRAENNQTELEVYYGLPIYEIVKKTPEDKNEIQLENGLAIHDFEWQPVSKQVRQTAIPFDRRNVKENDLFLDMFRSTVTPDSYHVALHVRPGNTPLLAVVNELRLGVPDYSTADFALSDIVLASSVESTEKKGKFIRHGQRIVPNPLRIYSLDKQVYVYFEVYNLTLNENEQSDFEVEYTVTKTESDKSIFGLFGKKQETMLTFVTKRQAADTFSPEYIAIDVSNLGKGEYKLTVKVIDKQSGKTVMKNNWLVLY